MALKFTPEQFRSLKRSYEKALKDKHEILVWENQELVMGYAKYLIEYLQPKFKGR